MAMSRVYTVAFQGIEAREVDVQVRIARSSNPAFAIVGLADKAVGESRDRVWAALSAIGLALPPDRITVNLAPADLPKEGSHYDLPITLAILAAMGVLPSREMAGYVALGELSLDASITPVAGVLPAALAASEAGRGLICPAASGAEAAWAGNIEIIAAPSLIALVNHVKGAQVLRPPTPRMIDESGSGLERFITTGVDDETRTKLSLLLLAIARNRAEDVAALLLSLSLTTLDSDEPAFLHELRRKLPRYQRRTLAGIRAGEALADLQRLCFSNGIRLPASFALVGKTLSQADSIARTLDPELDPIALIEEESLELILTEAEGRLEPDRFFGYLLTQLDALSRLPRRLGQLADRLESGTLKVGVAPTALDDTEHMLRSVANRVGAALIVVGLLVSSALMARVSHVVALVGFCLSGAIGLYMIWRIMRTPGEL